MAGTIEIEQADIPSNKFVAVTKLFADPYIRPTLSTVLRHLDNFVTSTVSNDVVHSGSLDGHRLPGGQVEV
jgi:hypothetical protein